MVDNGNQRLEMSGLTAHQMKYIAWNLSRLRHSSDDDKFTNVLSEAQVDLNPHQVEAALFAFRSPLSNGAILADEVGLGKTIEAALIISQHWAERKRHILIIAPATLRKQWSAELDEKFFLPSLILEKKNFNQILSGTYRNPFDTDTAIVICSYQFAAKQMIHLQRVNWDLVVMDEAHKLRNVYRGNNKIGGAIKTALQPYKKLLLTATPLQNDLKELYGLVSIIDDGFFGSLKGFSDQYSKVSLRSKDTYADLRKRIAPIVHRTLRSDVQEYVKYTERIPFVQEYYPSEDEQRLEELVTEYLQQEESYGLPRKQRSLITLLLHKLLSSSSFAIAGTLKAIIERLEGKVADFKKQQDEEKPEENLLEFEFDTYDEYAEEWADEEDEDEDDESPKEEEKLTEADIEEIQNEISRLNEFYNLAISIASNKKGECLLKALNVAFAQKRENGQSEKALIFTESTRTQAYVKELLEQNGYRGKIVLFNGSNSDPESKAIYKNWLEKNQNSYKVTGVATADKRQAIVDYFKDEAQIMIATEAASEGINLQFCSLLVNYDLPWNPQRVEQRIGRCHRYGQKNDVVVVNFINKTNRADQRVYELLDGKYNLFKGVFGASDEILGNDMDSLDFERRVLDIYQKCRSEEEIDAAFDALQQEMKESIDSTMKQTQMSLLENFDEDVVSKLKVRKDNDSVRLNKFQEDLWLLTTGLLGNNIEVTDSNKYKFRLLRSTLGDTSFVPGYYQIGKDVEDSYVYRISHPLAQWVIEKAKSLDTPDESLLFDYSSHASKISIIESKVGTSGILSVRLIKSSSAKDAQEHILLSAIDADGNQLDSEFTQKLLSIKCKSLGCATIDKTKVKSVLDSLQMALLDEIRIKNSLFIQEESAKIERWAEDQTFAAEQELKDIKKAIRDKTSLARITTEPEKQLAIQSELNSLQRQLKLKRANLFRLEDEIEEKRDQLIEQIERSLNQKVQEEDLFTIHWTIK